MDAFPELQLPESRVLIIITGGTICMRRSEDGLIPAKGFLKAGLAPRPPFNDGSYPEPLEIVTDDSGTRKAVQSLRTPISTYDRRVRYSVLEFDELLDSSSIDAAGWDHIAKSIYRNYQLFDGFVVLHGTDSLAYTCSALSFMLQNLGKPVILTGSQAPMMELQNDAQDNLLSSLIIAGHFMIPEVCLFFNFRLFRGNRTKKVSTDDFAAFASPNLPPLATISSLRTNVQWGLVYRPTSVNAFSIQTKLDTAHVACLRVFPGMKPEMVDAVLRLEGLKGLVLETFGAGNTPGGPDSAMTKILADAVKRGIVIVNVTQCLSGSVSPLYAPATVLGRAGVVFGQDLTTEAALAKLAYLLALPDSTPEEVSKRMSISLRGELTESTRTHFEHPKNGTLTPELSALTALAYSVQAGDLQGTRDVIRGESRWLLNDADYAGSTPMVREISYLLKNVVSECCHTNRPPWALAIPTPLFSHSAGMDVRSWKTKLSKWAEGEAGGVSATRLHSDPSKAIRQPCWPYQFPHRRKNCRKNDSPGDIRKNHFWGTAADTLLTQKHLAACGPNVEILKDFLEQGGSVHLRNREGHTPLFLAAQAGLSDHVRTLREAGAHLHSDEMAAARLHASSDADGAVWQLAGVGTG
ncbi:asparaginase-domain-containing protein [Glonium stellatum]|uniref:asparaginase n=1 Tax=Glonium stellatum TaxID=574774 RepID=A0A8E2JZ52_9PEZI|nr:asparaginase-domain-containing protein [Glonium stellatum]